LSQSLPTKDNGLILGESRGALAFIGAERFRICLVNVLAAKTELKTIASKIIQHPAATIERIKLRRRVIELSVQTMMGGAAAPSR
jgi:hypothetical protein